VSIEKVIVEYGGPAKAFVFEGIEFVRGVAQTVEKDLADLLKRVDPEHAFAVSKTATADESPTAKSSGLPEDDSPAPE